MSHNVRKISITLLTVSIISFLVFISVIYDNNSLTFYKNTYINDINVSNLTAEETKNKLTEEWNKNDFEFEFDDGSREDVLLSDVGLEYDIMKSIEENLQSPSYINRFKWFFGIKNDFTIAMKSNGSNAFVKEISEFDFCDNSDKEKTKDAYVDLSNTDFKVVKEIIGTETDPLEIEKIALSCIENGEFSTQINSSDVIKQPEVTADSARIKQDLQYAKENLSYKITYIFGEDKKTITPKELNKMVEYNGSDAKVHSKKVKKYVSKLAEEYNEYGETYKFKKHNGDKKEIQAVSFGRILDQDAEVKHLKKALKKKKSEKRKPKWIQNFYQNSDKNGGIGTSYVEVDTGRQHLWCYVNGKKQFDCDVVTGSIGHETHKGVFKIDWKARNMTLKGTNSDGSKYASFVNFFMPFNQYGEGMHDADGWRSVYGPSVSRYRGSHGCVNMPYRYAKELYGIVEPGFPVIVY